MELTTIEIKNFKGLRECSFEPGSFSCLVGENNAGKSSVLQAIVIAIGRQNTLNPSLFYDKEQPVEFKWTFTGITQPDLDRIPEEHKDRLAPLLADGNITFCSRYRVDQKLDLKIMTKEPRDGRFKKNSIDEGLKGKRGAAISQTVRELFEGRNVEIPEITTIAAAKEFINAQIGTFTEAELETVEAPLPSGISSSLGSFLPEPIYIPAVKNLGDDLKTTHTTSFGKLISLLLEDLSPDLQRFENSFNELKRFLNRPTEPGAEDQRHDRVRYLETQIERNLAANFPRLKVELAIPPPELKTILSSAQLFVDDGSKDLIDNKGDGVKRSLTFSILKTYVDELEVRAATIPGQTVSKRPIILLFEEPELYLHPKSQKILFQALSKISDDHQVIATTHSPIFFAPNITASFVRVAKEDDQPKPVGRLYPVNFRLNTNLANVFKLARFENADAAFFSTRVVLFEGDSDEHFIRHAATLIRDSWNFDRANIALIAVNGKGNFRRYKEFFGAFNIVVHIVADLDALFDGFEHLNASQEATTIRTTCIQQLDQLIARDPSISSTPNSKQIKKRVKNPAWKERFLNLKAQIDALTADAPVPKQLKDDLEQLFSWNEHHRRLDAVYSSTDAIAAMDPLRRKLFDEKIYVLRKGAIEDYYPTNVEGTLPKPQRAIRAVELLENRQSLLPLTIYRTNEQDVCEFEEFLNQIFVGHGE